MQNLHYLFVAVLMGIIMSIYLPMNSSVARHVGSAFTANMTFFLAALITSIFLFIIFGKSHSLSLLKDVPVYLYMTGCVSAFIVLGTTVLIPHLGARKLFILVVSGQIIMAVIVSHFGVLESPKDPITFKKMCGAMFVILGAYISSS